eukprot:jgi/Ulvmu1/1073/UM105_0032.1
MPSRQAVLRAGRPRCESLCSLSRRSASSAVSTPARSIPSTPAAGTACAATGWSGAALPRAASSSRCCTCGRRLCSSAAAQATSRCRGRRWSWRAAAPRARMTTCGSSSRSTAGAATAAGPLPRLGRAGAEGGHRRARTLPRAMRGGWPRRMRSAAAFARAARSSGTGHTVSGATGSAGRWRSEGGRWTTCVLPSKCSAQTRQTRRCSAQRCSSRHRWPPPRQGPVGRWQRGTAQSMPQPRVLGRTLPAPRRRPVRPSRRLLPPTRRRRWGVCRHSNRRVRWEQKRDVVRRRGRSGRGWGPGLQRFAGRRVRMAGASAADRGRLRAQVGLWSTAQHSRRRRS